MTKHVPMSRRTALKGLGVAVSLPLLEAMLPRTLLGAGAGKPPLRAAFLYVPNGKHMPAWTPPTLGPLGELPATLKPLEPFKQELLVLSGLTLDKARPHGDGPGDHARAMAAFLTGRQPRKTHGADIRVGVSVDQVAAQKIGQSTRFPSLEIGCEGGRAVGNCDSGYSCAYQSTVSWRGEATPMAKEVNPRLVFERLFAAPGQQGGAAQARRDFYKRSILDFVAEDANRLKGRLGATDQRKLDEYLTGVREIERRLARVEKAVEVPGAGGAKVVPPAGIPKTYETHLRLMADMMVLAFQADLTRVSTFVFANDGSNRSYRDIGVSEGHHELSHHGNNRGKQDKIARINQFHIAQVAYLLGRLKAVREGDGTLLDNCMIVYGSGIGDGNRHNHDDLPILLAGKAGGTVQPGRHVRYRRETPLMNLYLSMLDRLGVSLDSFGDSTGRLTDLEG